MEALLSIVGASIFGCLPNSYIQSAYGGGGYLLALLYPESDMMKVHRAVDFAKFFSFPFGMLNLLPIGALTIRSLLLLFSMYDIAKVHQKIKMRY